MQYVTNITKAYAKYAKYVSQKKNAEYVLPTLLMTMYIPAQTAALGIYMVYTWYIHGIMTVWNSVHLVYGGTRQYVLVHPGTHASGDMAVRETWYVPVCTDKWYVSVCTDTENSYFHTFRYVPVCTVLNRHGTSWYKLVQGGT